ncbi:MAG: acyl-CoA dehydrogenase [Hyphomicrobiales bacterium]
MSYRAPVSDIAFTLNQIAGMQDLLEQGVFGDLDADTVNAVLDEAGRFAGERIGPLNRQGDLEGAALKDGAVALPKGWREVYEQWVEAGWGSLQLPESFGGQGLPIMLSMAVCEMWQSASMAFSLNPMLTQGAAEALGLHGSDDLKAVYLEKMVSGEWTGSMQLTEPQAGSDLRLLKTRAVPQPDGSYKLTGTKIFITYGEHDLTDNIVHMILARLPDAPEGTKGISLFLVPKFLVRADGSLGERNDIRCVSLEHKLGIHASPTCVMQMGDGGGATGWLVGEKNHGLAAMFTMMNRARLAVGIQGVGIAERATQQAIAFAHERRQGHLGGDAGPVPIVRHPDVRRMLLSMQARTAAARAICYATARALDLAERLPDEAGRKRAHALGSLLTPVAKAWSTDIGVEVASTGIQVHGGMGFIEETGAAQHLRDARIAPIYEGTNGIQAIDLVTRKLALEQGETVRRHIAGMRAIAGEVKASNLPAFGRTAERLEEAVGALEEATAWLLTALAGDPQAALAGATPYLRLFGVASGGCYLARGALAESREGGPGRMTALARHFAEHHCTEARGLAGSVTEGALSVLGAADPALAG